ncbi:MAG: glycerol-3-phosphate dehydrogenase/oxidase, partial [Candidatus Limnocylindrales bacterium]
MPAVKSELPNVMDARRKELELLANTRWDLLVVGGGITGCGVLLDAASRGMHAALIERDDFAVGTSSRSSRLIHGGLRYLEQFQVGLVREALRERARLLRIAPHLVRLEPFLFPVYGGIWNRPFYGAGLTLYDLLGASADGGFHRHISADEALEAVPSLRRKSLRGGFVYHDGQEDDARYVIAVLRTARAQGGTAVSRVVADRLLDSNGRVAGCLATDGLTADKLEIRADVVVDATGVWASRPEGPFASGESRSILPSRGTHLVVRRDRIPSRYGLTLRIPGRVCFLVPGPTHWVIGTTDIEDRHPSDRPVPTAGEVAEILGNVNRTLDVDLTVDDVVAAYAGIRPLALDPSHESGGTVKASREHRIRTERNGLVRVSGGKFTTYRLMAEQTVDAAIVSSGWAAGRGAPKSKTTTLPLVGAASASQLASEARDLTERTGLDRAQVDHLVGRHGMEARDVIELGRERDLLRPLGQNGRYLEAEAVWAVQRESALSLDDI